MNRRTAPAETRTILNPTIAVAVSLILAMLAGCSSGSGVSLATSPAGSSPVSQPTPSVVVEVNKSLGNAPHLFDVYRATNADKAIIFLHGAAGNKHHAAYQFGINLSDVDADYSSVNETALLKNKAVTVFPQGQALFTSPSSTTWSNYVTDSGQDDMAFIRSLVESVRGQYAVSRVYIVGHSTGGMMVNRIWCEEPDLFDSYIAIAGPPSARFLDSATPCAPATVKPYLGIIRTDDKVLGSGGNWDAPTWTINQAAMLPAADAFLNPVVIGERDFLKTRVSMRCGETVPDGDASAVTSGAFTTWSYCSNSMKLMRVMVNPGAGLSELDDEVWQFLSPQ